MSGRYVHRASGEGGARKHRAHVVRRVGHAVVNAIARRIAGTGEGRRRRVVHRRRRLI
jgi:hypothetical protein